MDTKKPWLSKTLWINFGMAALALFVPGAHEWAMMNPEMITIIFTVVNTGLRLASKEKLQLRD
jgi:hypothetical protein